MSGYGYKPVEVDAFREEIRDTFLGATRSPVKSDDVRGKQFSSTRRRRPTMAMTRSRLPRSSMPPASGWPRWSRRTGQTGPLVSGAILAGWAEWADSTRFSTSRLREGYDTAEVDAFREAIRDTFLGVRRPPLTWPAAHGKQFTTTRRPGYDPEQVDAFLDKAEPRLAAMRATDKGAT